MQTTPIPPVQPLSETVGIQLISSGNTNIIDLDEALVINLFKAEGLLLFRGFETNVDIFTQFTNKFSQNFLDYTGGVLKRRVINNNPTVLSVNDFKHELKLHGEMYYQEQRPLMLWFFCNQPAAQDGETIVCDGKRLFEALSQPLKALFTQKKLKFHVHLDQATWIARYKTDDLEQVKAICKANNVDVSVNEDGSIDANYICPAVYPSRSNDYTVFINSLLPAKALIPNDVCFDDGSNISDDVMAELNGIADSITEKVCWQKGDILMLDNTRIMHGRRSFTDPNRDIYVRLCSPSFPF